MSTENVLPVGTKVKRISNGATGEVVETNEEELARIIAAGGKLYPSRRRIKWDTQKSSRALRTWIAVKDLVALS